VKIADHFWRVQNVDTAEFEMQARSDGVGTFSETETLPEHEAMKT